MVTVVIIAFTSNPDLKFIVATSGHNSRAAHNFGIAQVFRSARGSPRLWKYYSQPPRTSLCNPFRITGRAWWCPPTATHLATLPRRQRRHLWT
jgi:hypothetical protein